MIWCVDCDMPIHRKGQNGRLPLRCDPCRRANRAAKWREWRDADPERAKEAARKSHAKRQADPEWRELNKRRAKEWRAKQKAK